MADSILPEDLNIAKLGQLAASPKPADIQRATVMEPKLDGHRLYIWRGEGDDVRAFARSGVEKGKLVPHIIEAAARAPAGTWFDGEVCKFYADGALDAPGANDWGLVQSVLGADRVRPHLAESLTYAVFDIIAFDGLDIRALPLATRRKTIEEVVDSLGLVPPFMVVPQYDATAEEYQRLIDAGFEGAILKDPLAPYASGKRGKGWYKRKVVETEEVVVIGSKEGKGKFRGLVGALVFGQYRDGKLTELGACSGMTDGEREEFTRLDKEGRLVGTVIEIAHMGRMPTGGFRHPQFKRVRTDKLAEECV